MTELTRGLGRAARIDLETFASNLAGVNILDARADAYGHSLVLVAPVARAAGVTTLVISDERDAAVAREAGFSDLHIGRLFSGPEAVAGAEAYGVGSDATTQPVMTLTAEVIAVKRVGVDAGVSYGYTYRTSAPTTLALVGLGYADGVPRLASNRAQVLVAGTLRPLVGRVAMDQFVVDCKDSVPEVGSEVVLFGDPATGAPAAHEWATATERSELALTSGLGSRIRREAAK